MSQKQKPTTPIHMEEPQTQIQTQAQAQIQSQCEEFANMLTEFHREQINKLTLKSNDPYSLQQTIETMKQKFETIKDFVSGKNVDIQSLDPDFKDFLEKLNQLLPNYNCEVSVFIDSLIQDIESNNFLTVSRDHLNGLYPPTAASLQENDEEE